ncbi:MAG: ribonuclease HII [Elusimicrobia bacterium]|nr:ribonuclease HII [Elusimicrobiota bacterium]
MFDEALRSHYHVSQLIGVDEVGRGPLAGPVVAAAVLLGPAGLEALACVRDSKALSPSRRLALYGTIRRVARSVGVGYATAEEIDRRNVLQATFLAMRRAVARLGAVIPDSLVIVDGNHPIPELPYEQKALARADAFSLAVASASIVAKVLRDRWMGRLDVRHPGYGFSRHKGYGTADHLRALARLGPSPVHRMSFEPVAQARFF